MAILFFLTYYILSSRERDELSFIQIALIDSANANIQYDIIYMYIDINKKKIHKT